MNTQFSKKDTNIVKGVAIIAMLFHHCYVTNINFKAHGVSFAPFSKGTVVTLSLWAKVCVGIFVFLSAYGITISLKKLYDQNKYERQNISWLTIRRVWKIRSGFWPIYILAIVGCKVWAPESFAVYKQGMIRIIYMLIDFSGLAHIFGTPTLLGTWWYLGLAFMEIMLLPFLYYMYRKCGAFITIALSYLLPMALSLPMSSSVVHYLPAMTLGIWFAQEDLFPKAADWRIPHTGLMITRVAEFCVLAVFILGTVWLKTSKFGKVHPNVTDSVTPLAVILFTYLFLASIPILRDMLCILGKYSMNIFLFHNFIRSRWFEDFSYSFRFWWLIVIVLVIDCLLFSVVIEFLKEVLRYNHLTIKIEKKLHGMISNE